MDGWMDGCMDTCMHAYGKKQEKPRIFNGEMSHLSVRMYERSIMDPLIPRASKPSIG